MSIEIDGTNLGKWARLDEHGIRQTIEEFPGMLARVLELQGEARTNVVCVKYELKRAEARAVQAAEGKNREIRDAVVCLDDAVDQLRSDVMDMEAQERKLADARTLLYETRQLLEARVSLRRAESAYSE